MDVEEKFKIGFLFMPPQSFLRKTWNKKFCALYKASNHGIQRLEVFDSEDAFLKLSPSKIIPLTECVKATYAPQKHQSNVFEICTKTNNFQFSADSFQEMTDWVNAVQTVAFGVTRRSSNGINANIPFIKDVKQEENMLYSSMDEPEMYCVQAVDTEAAVRNGLQGDYKLIITPISLAIAEDGPNGHAGKILFTWLYRHIRRYGCSKDSFSFEAGRKCASGEGLFTFLTKDSSHIFQSVDAHVSSLKASSDDIDPPSSPIVKDGSNSGFDKSALEAFRQSPLTQRYVNKPDNVEGYVASGPLRNKERLRNSFPLQSDSDLFLKPGQPILKPPRKSKSKSDTTFQDDNVNASSLSRISTVSISSQPNIYNDPNEAKGNLETDYEKSNSLQGRSFESNSVCSGENLDSSQEPVYAVLEENTPGNVELSALTDEFKQVLSNQKDFLTHFNRKDTSENPEHVYCSSDSSSYDHLDLKTTMSSRPPITNLSEDHIYGKLLPARSSSAVVGSQNSGPYGTLLTKRSEVAASQDGNQSTHSYINVCISNPSVANDASTSCVEPQHFLQNDVEYAQVLKKGKC